jgi:hypothetical protein
MLRCARAEEEER